MRSKRGELTPNIFIKTKRNPFQLWLFGMLLLVLPAMVQAQFTYTTANGAITITGYTGSDNTVIIPGTINGLPVTSIGDYAFEDDTFTNVTIPDSVTYIGQFAFQYCVGLTNVTIPDSVTYIDFDAFEHCAGLINITLGNHVNYIEASAFTLCENLTSVTIPDSVTNLGEGAFDDCINLTTVKTGNGLTSIGLDVFLDCRSMTNLTIGTNITSIAGDAFLLCVQLPSITISKSVTNIDSGAFNECASLAAITVNPANPAYSSVNGVLFDKNRTTLVEYPGGRSGSYTVPGGVTSIENIAFSGCNDLTGITIPDSVTNIGVAAFADCTSLTGITLPNSITSIAVGAFQDSSLISVTIPGSVTNIGDQAFDQCFNLAAVYCEGNAPVVGTTQVFDNDPGVVYYLAGTTGWSTTYGGLPTVMLGANGQAPRIIGSGVKTNEFRFSFNGTSNQVIVVEASTNLTDWQPIQTNTLGVAPLNFTDSQWRNYSRRFYRLVLAEPPAAQVPYIWITNNGTITITGYTGPGGDVTLPSFITGRPVTSIGVQAFYFQNNLGTVLIPDSITNIGTEAFSSCDNLVGFTVDGANPAYSSVQGVLFDKHQTNLVVFPEGKLGSYTIPDGVTTIGEYAFSSGYLSSVTVPNSVNNIGDYAFLACGNLTGVYFQGNAPTLGGPDVFFNTTSATVYYQTGTTGWGTTYGGLPAVSQ